MNESIEIERRAIEKENAKFDEELDGEKESENNTETTLKTPSDYHHAIKEIITKLPQVEKSKIQAIVIENKLPKAYQKLTDIDQLKKYYEIVSR